MNRKIIFITTIIAIVTFLSGWFLRSIFNYPGKNNDGLIISGFADTLKNTDTHKTTMAGNFNNTTISGRFILAQSNCAGFNFINNTTVLWTNEIACDDPDTLKIHWLDNTTFMTKTTVRIDQNCPPKIDIYNVVSFDGKHLGLKSAATGWNDSADVILDFTKQSDQ
ncbi:hypothetical protein [Ferruginibacter profundus]